MNHKKLMIFLAGVFAAAGGILLVKSAGELLDLDLGPFDLED